MKWCYYLIVVLGTFGIFFILFPAQWPWILLIMLIFFGAIFGLFVPLYKEEKKYSYITGLRYWDAKSSRDKSRIHLPIPPLISEFDEIPNVANLINEYVHDKNPIVRRVTAKAVAEHFDKIPNAEKIVEILVEDKDKYVRINAIEIINRHFDKISNAKKIIENLAEDEDRGVRISIIELINEHFDNIQNAEKIIERFVKDEDRYVRYYVANTIGFKFDKISNAGKMLEKLAQDENEMVRDEAIRIIEEKWNYPAEIYRSKFSESFVKNILSKTGSSEIQMLKDMLSEEIDEKKIEEIHNLAERILCEYKNENKIALGRIILENFYKFPNPEKIVENMLNDKDAKVRIIGCEILMKHFNRFPNAEKIIEKLMKDSRLEPNVSDIISKYFENLRNINVRAAQNILEIMANSNNKYVRWVACSIAANNIGRISNALSILEKLKTDEAKSVRNHANYVLKEREKL